tara:strand:+ start:2300 stop:2536 length:237 start_codon:yes stop_codon:yes gene_type:complete
MEDENSLDPSNSDEENNKVDSEPFNIVGFDSDSPSRSVFNFFGYEFIAPSGMKKPALIYILFSLVNLIIFTFLFSKLF